MLGCTTVPLQNLWLTERRTVIETEKRRWIRRVTAPRVPWQIGDSSKIGRQCTQTESERPELLTSWRLKLEDWEETEQHKPKDCWSSTCSSTHLLYFLVLQAALLSGN